MQIGKVNLPCGCEARKEILVTQGNWTTGLALAVAGMIAVTVLAYVVGREAK